MSIGGGCMSNIGNKETMSKNLKYYIEKSGKDRKDLAKIWGFPYSTVTEWINGKKYPRIDRIEIMADYFGIQKSDLIEEKTEKSTDEQMLTDAEKTLLSLFREVPVEMQDIVLGMIEVSLKNRR
jgi:transcriptional regulator with XRE-family HTH domain